MVPNSLQRFEGAWRHGVGRPNPLEAKADEGLLVVYCQSMAGGIDAWSCAIDAAVPRY